MKGHLSKGVIATLLASVMVLSGCTKTPTKTEPAADSNKPVNLKIMWWGAQERHDATLKALAEYTKQFPNVTFTPEYLSWDGYWSKLTVLAASNTVPDVLQMDASVLPDYVKKGQLADISSINLSGVVDSKLVNNLKIGGKLYTIPLGMNGQGNAYNKVDLTAAGVTLPKAGWTWTDYWAFAEEGRAKLPKDKYAIGDGTNMWDNYQYYQTGNGKGPIMKDGKFNLDKTLWYAFNNKFVEYRKNGTVPPAAVTLSFIENDAKADSMASLKVMTRGATVGSVSALNALMPTKQVSVVNIPNGSSGGGWAQATIFLSIGKNSKNIADSKKFVKWFIADKTAGTILGTVRGIPVNDAIYTQLQPTLPASFTIIKGLLDVAKPKALPFYAAPSGWVDWIATYKSEMESVMFGKETLDTAYANIKKSGDATAIEAAQ
ncbi:MAG TPA: extracellular solute-binding protein [Clostridiaceae bacterium]